MIGSLPRPPRHLLPGALLALLLAGAAGEIWISHLRYEQTQRVERLKLEQTHLRREVNKLQLEVASLTRPERLRRLAREKFGMAPPRPMQVTRP